MALVNNFYRGKRGLLLIGGANGIQTTLDMAAGLTGSTQIKFWEIDDLKSPNAYTVYDLQPWFVFMYAAI